MSHTPGPWNIYFNSQDDLVIRKMCEDVAESRVVTRCNSGMYNARLIAAAPDLLEALIESKQWHQGDKWRDDADEDNKTAWQLHMNVIDDAIAKATNA